MVPARSVGEGDEAFRPQPVVSIGLAQLSFEQRLLHADAGLRWRDIDLEAAMLSVRYTLQRGRQDLPAGRPKTRQSRRTIAVPEIAVTALKSHRIRQAEERLGVGKDWNDLWRSGRLRAYHGRTGFKGERWRPRWRALSNTTAYWTW